MNTRLLIPKYAKDEARKALIKRRSLPKSKKFGLIKEKAQRLGINSGVQRAKQITRSTYLDLEDAKSVARFYQRFKNKRGPRAKGAISLWGGRAFGRKAVKFVEESKKRKKK